MPFALNVKPGAKANANTRAIQTFPAPFSNKRRETRARRRVWSFVKISYLRAALPDGAAGGEASKLTINERVK
jgi:hypothetical protein